MSWQRTCPWCWLFINYLFISGNRNLNISCKAFFEDNGGSWINGWMCSYAHVASVYSVCTRCADVVTIYLNWLFIHLLRYLQFATCESHKPGSVEILNVEELVSNLRMQYVHRFVRCFIINCFIISSSAGRWRQSPRCEVLLRSEQVSSCIYGANFVVDKCLFKGKHLCTYNGSRRSLFEDRRWVTLAVAWVSV